MQVLSPRNSLPACLLLLAFLPCAPAWAGRPLVTEDAGALAPSNCESESFIGKQSRPDLRFGLTQVGCGVGGNSQLTIGASRYVSGGDTSRYLALSGKTGLGSQDGQAVRFALAYGLYGGKQGGNAMKLATAEIKGVMSVSLGHWLLHANAGVLHFQQEHEERLTWAGAAERTSFVGNIDLMGEIFGDNKADPCMQAALRWNAVPGRLSFDGSYGVQMDAKRSRIATLGIKLAF